MGEGDAGSGYVPPFLERTEDREETRNGQDYVVTYAIYSDGYEAPLYQQEVFEDGSFGETTDFDGLPLDDGDLADIHDALENTAELETEGEAEGEAAGEEAEEPGPDAEPDAAVDAAPDAQMDAGPDAGSDADVSDAGGDAAADSEPSDAEAGSEAAAEGDAAPAGPDAGPTGGEPLASMPEDPAAASEADSDRHGETADQSIDSRDASEPGQGATSFEGERHGAGTEPGPASEPAGDSGDEAPTHGYDGGAGQSFYDVDYSTEGGESLGGETPPEGSDQSCTDGSGEGEGAGSDFEGERRGADSGERSSDSGSSGDSQDGGK